MLDKLAGQNFSGVSPALKAELLDFFGHPDAHYAMKDNTKKWAKVQADVEKLKMANGNEALKESGVRSTASR